MFKTKTSNLLTKVMAVCAVGASVLPFLLFGTGKDAKALTLDKQVNSSDFVIDVDDATTTEATTESGGNSINDFDVHMNEDGTISTSLDDKGDATTTFSTIFQKGKIYLAGFSGVGTIAFGFFFIFNFIKIGAAGDNPTARKAAMVGTLWTGIAAALSGSTLMIVGLFWNAFK